MAHVFSMALGPVQDFIAAARRTRDLWFGSWLLSELARAAGQEIAKNPANSLVFPHSERLRDPEATFTNKVLAVVAGEPGEVAAAIRTAIRARLDVLRSEAFSGLRQEEAEGRFFASRAKAQIDDLIEIQWASAEITADQPYAAARKLAESVLGGRKNTRLFAAVTWGDQIPKSAIDGQRESVIHEDLYDAQQGRGPDFLFRTYRVADAERLCGVGLLKRLGRHRTSKFAHHFLSTGHLAAMPLLEKISTLAQNKERRVALEAAWQHFLSAAQRLEANLDDCEVYVEQRGHPVLGPYDAGLLFENRLPELFTSPDRRERLRRAKLLAPALRGFLKEVGEAPKPYYAVLVADGDHMGKTIESIAAEPRHRELSSRLTEFARHAVRIVEEEHRGELILAGGDDVLAFVPLHRAVACARDLAETFQGLLAEFSTDGQPAPTLSVGIGISHFLEPLSRALEVARAAERQAKVARSSLALKVDKRSGAPLTITGHWGESDLALDDFVKLHVNDLVPDGLAFDLRELARLLEGAPDRARTKLIELVTKEAQRIVRQKQPKQGREERLADTTREQLQEIYGRLDRNETLGGARLTEFADRMIVARLLAEARLQASPTAEARP